MWLLRQLAVLRSGRDRDGVVALRERPRQHSRGGGPGDPDRAQLRRYPHRVHQGGRSDVKTS